MIDLQLIKTFLTVLETGNYSNAALKLDYAQSTVTKHIKLLEDAYHGTKLLYRQGNRMLPTEQGQILQKYAGKMLQLYEASLGEIIVSEKRIIHIGTTYALSETYLPIVVQQIKRKYPNINIRLTGGTPQALYSLLRSGQLDAMFLIDTDAQYQNFTVKKIKQEPLVIVIPENHRLSVKSRVSFHDIKEENFILTENGCSFRKCLLNEFSKHALTPQIVMELDSIRSIKQAIINQQGIGFMPSFLVNSVDKLLPIEFESSASIVYSMIVYAENDLCTKPFINFIADSIMVYHKNKTQ